MVTYCAIIRPANPHAVVTTEVRQHNEFTMETDAVIKSVALSNHAGEPVRGLVVKPLGAAAVIWEMVSFT